MRVACLLLIAAIAAPAFAADGKKPGAGKDKMICKREIPIGSLIATRKRCMTKEQWAQVERDGNEEARRMMYEGTTRQRSN